MGIVHHLSVDCRMSTLRQIAMIFNRNILRDAPVKNEVAWDLASRRRQGIYRESKQLPHDFFAIKSDKNHD